MSTDTKTTATWHTVVPTALGELTLVRDATAFTGLYFPHHWYLPTAAVLGERDDAGFGELVGQLEEYVAGRRREFALPVRLAGGDAFQRRVWARLRQVPYGQTVTYGQLAAEFGGTVHARMVGGAVGRNPLSVVVPCHRVVGHDGRLTGYAGGLARKRRLLDIEQDQASLDLENGGPAVS